jgi:ATP-dependent Clp protease, protease subunit
VKRFKNEKYNKIANEIKHEFKAETKGSTTEITIYGDIGESFWGESVSASDIKNALRDIETESITIRLNSPGGDAFDGISIRNTLKDHKAKVTVIVDGLAASAASIIAMGADEVIMNTGSMMMIHEASTFAWGTKADIKKTLNALEGIDKSIADIYMTRFNGDLEELNSLVESETWLTANETVEKGFADKVNEVKDDDAEVTNLKNLVINLQTELEQMKNQSKEKEPVQESVKNSNLSKLFLNLN